MPSKPLADALRLVLVDLAAERDGSERRGHGDVHGDELATRLGRTWTAKSDAQLGSRRRLQIAVRRPISWRLPTHADPARSWPSSSLAAGDQLVLAEGVDLVALQLGVLAGGGQARSPGRGCRPRSAS